MLGEFDKFDLPKIEEQVLDFWKKNKIFQKSLQKRREAKQFVFYEGPPYANGLPGVHHVLARVFKDIILRYKSMAGFYVPRRAGWDTHGLPIELAAEKELGISSKREVEELGLDKFNRKARETAFRFKKEFEKMTERIGYWLDLENAYITCSNDYIEKLWGVLKKISQRGLLKKDYKILPWCPRCGTPLASHELAQPGAYKMVSDPSLYVKFPADEEEKTFFLVWTTTPWTLPANVLIAVNPRLKYRKFKVGEEFIWSHIVPPGLKDEDGLEEVSGEELVGRRYRPLFGPGNKDGQRLVAADFVSAEEGTGLVHIAPAFGEDDLNLAKKIGLKQFPTTINDRGEVNGDFPGAGKYIKEADKDIVADLEKRGLVFQVGEIEHEYPHCWRSGDPLIYFARDSWFIEMSRLRKELVAANEKINWTPAYIKEGRFGEWIKEAKDWAISRERYWGTPLPIWECGKCGRRTFVGSKKEFAKLTVSSGNRYFILRHGEADSNVFGTVSSSPEKAEIDLTPRGLNQSRKAAAVLKQKKLDLIFSSPIRRTRETAEIVGAATGAPVAYDNRIIEFNVGKFNGRPEKEVLEFIVSQEDRFAAVPEGGESLNAIRARMMGFFRELDEKYKGKRILIVSHAEPLWLLEGASQGMSEPELIDLRFKKYIQPGELRELNYLRLPYDQDGRLDWHRPYVDEVKLTCPRCRGEMKRVSEVADVWFDSGSMPFAGGFYPRLFPADYIGEGLDQTRGWFYVLLAVSVLLGHGNPYKNVICLGLVLDKYGQKMSKSKGNIVSPNEIIDKYGVDVLRWYFYTVNDPGEPKRFDEKDLTEIARGFFFLIYNVFSFYRLYSRGDKPFGQLKISRVLDRWIYSRLEETIVGVTEKLEAYNIGAAGRELAGFADDLSRWYLRRSRSRFQRPESEKDLIEASSFLRELLLQFSRLIAPFAPFFGEALFKALSPEESVHLADWPRADQRKIDRGLSEKMAKIREIAAAALAKRAEAGVKIRQPLAELRIKGKRWLKAEEILEILKDEVNVKKIAFDPDLGEDIRLDLEITPELKQEGSRREFVRMVQEMRQKADLKPGEEIIVEIEAPAVLQEAIQTAEVELKKMVSAREIQLRLSDKFELRNELETPEGGIILQIRRV